MKLRQRLGVFFGILVLALGAGAVPASASSTSMARVSGPWTIRPETNVNSYCLDIADSDTGNGAYLQLNYCYSGWWNQQFYLYEVPGYFQVVQIVPRHSWRCLDVEGVSLANGARIQQYDCLGYGQLNQLWGYTTYSGGLYAFAAMHSYKDMVNYGVYPGAPVVQSWQNNKWVLVPA